MMSLFRILVLDVLTFIFSVLVAHSIYSILKFFCSTLSITNVMIRENIIPADLKFQLYFSSFGGALVTFIIFSILAYIAAYLSNGSGLIVLASGLFVGLFVIKPTKDRYTVSQYTLDEYKHRYRACIDMDKYNEYICKNK